jgi:hypothetical protein
VNFWCTAVSPGILAESWPADGACAPPCCTTVCDGFSGGFAGGGVFFATRVRTFGFGFGFSTLGCGAGADG